MKMVLDIFPVIMGLLMLCKEMSGKFSPTPLAPMRPTLGLLQEALEIPRGHVMTLPQFGFRQRPAVVQVMPRPDMSSVDSLE